MKTFTIRIRNVGAHQYYSPSKGSVALTIAADDSEAADAFGSGLAAAMSERDERFDYDGAQEVET